jgi:hypothetical protein
MDYTHSNLQHGWHDMDEVKWTRKLLLPFQYILSLSSFSFTYKNASWLRYLYRTLG